NYDYQGRRIQKILSTWNGSAYVAQSTNKFVYDGWNLMAELNGTNGVLRTFLWALDLSGTAQGTGGVGGLLTIKRIKNEGTCGMGRRTGLPHCQLGGSSV